MTVDIWPGTFAAALAALASSESYKNLVYIFLAVSSVVSSDLLLL